jgi:hypothetical protein
MSPRGGWRLTNLAALTHHPSPNTGGPARRDKRTATHRYYCTPYQMVGYQLPDGTFAPNLLGVNFSAYTPEPGMFGTIRGSEAALRSDAVGVVTGRASGLHQYGVGGTREGRRPGLGQESVATPAKASGVCAFGLPLRARVHRLKRLRKNKL